MLYGCAACAGLPDSVRCLDPDSAAVYVSQSDWSAGPEHAHDGRRHDRHDALDGLEPARRRLLYYDVSSAWQVIQQIFVTQKVIDKAKADEEERLKNAPLQVEVTRREKKPRPHKKK